MRTIIAGSLCLSVWSVWAGDAAQIYQAVSPEPTPDEVVILELINRFRADPAGEAARILAASAQEKAWCFNGVDAAMFAQELKTLKTAPPLVFNLQLLACARKHSHYMILNGLTHDEDPGKPGYTGKSASDRAKAVGYRVSALGENCYAGATGAVNSHLGFVVDPGKGGPGGMQPKRGHRMNLINPMFTEVGPGAVPNGKGLSVTHVLGKGERAAGGVAFVDVNGNGTYDAGEGRAGVVITANNGASAKTWNSGAFTLGLKSDAAGTLTAEYAGARYTLNYPAGKDNVHFCWAIPSKSELALADRLIASTAATTPESSARLRAQVELALASRSWTLDAERAARIKELIGDVGSRLDTAMKSAREALAAGDKAAAKTIADAAKPWRATPADAWFREAELCLRLTGPAEDLIRRAGSATKAERPAPSAIRTMLADLRTNRVGLKDTGFQAYLDGLIPRLKAVEP